MDAIMEAPAWLTQAWSAVEPYASRLMLWRGYERELQTLLIYAVGIALYTALVFAFYQNISKRDAFQLLRRPGWRGRVLAIAQSGLLFPLMSFLYFAVLAGSLFVLAKSQATYQITLLAMSVVVGVRVTAYMSENAAVDLAKMLPLALLGVLIVDPSYATLATTKQRLLDVPGLFPVLWRFFVLFVVLEAALRLGHVVVARASKGRSRRVEVQEPAPPMKKAP